MNLPLIVLLLVFILIAARRIGRLRIAIWQTMTAGALAVLLTGQIPLEAALRAIDLDVMVFLFGMFVLGRALVASGYLYAAAYRLLRPLRSVDSLVFGIVALSGLSSAVLMNDTLAIVGTPLVLRLAEEHRISPKLLLLALAFGITTGSVTSPIGNPQNLLIATGSGLDNPFLSFLGWLGLPTLAGLVLVYAVLRLGYRREFHRTPLSHAEPRITDPALARWAKLGLALVVCSIGIKVANALWGWALPVALSHIALAGAAPVLLASHRRLELLRDIDWKTLLFFAAMFVLMASVWRTGWLQGWLTASAVDLTTLPAVLGAGAGLSQLISNVPLVALYLPMLLEAGAGTESLMALAAGSTLAGNLLVLGAASNVIVIQAAERRGQTLGFVEFARLGLPLAALQLGAFWLWLAWAG